MEEVSTLGLMAKNMMVNGKMEHITESEGLLILKESRGQEDGNMVKELNG